MSIGRIAGGIHRQESGFAMIVAVVLMGVISTLMVLVLTVGTHTEFSTGRGRSWVQALHVAEAGVQDAITELEARLSSDSFTSPMTLTGSTDEGTFDVTVTLLPRRRFQIEATGTVAEGAAGLEAARRIRVTMAPPRSFQYALFSNTTVETKDNDDIDGDIWANENVIVDQNDTVTGSVTAATGYVRLKNGSLVTGDVWSGGFNPDAGGTGVGYAIELGNNATVDGSAKASVTTPDCSGESSSNYKVHLAGGSLIKGNVITFGEKTGSGDVGPGTITNNSCTAAPATKVIPTFTYSAANYDGEIEYGTPETPSATAVTDFQSYVDTHKSTFSGTFYVNQSGAVSQDLRIDLSDVKIVGDTTVIANVPIFTNRMEDDTQDAILTLVSTYRPPTGSSCDVNQDRSECSIHLKNNFQTSGATAVIVYAPFGSVAVKNNQAQFGTIYADNIQIKNNQTLTYDERTERAVGFGPVTYEVQTWIELAP